ncbi:hypothetical protein BHECKSOX_1240 [Bathymodiolus heckerae thiotrophic gill symbiont]|uniref:type II toxin-antitoxin system VapC family toxin n=1 Tax=Bathymodiolus heckerae thiotrophic gill symbiont TaxID=1052212 RepID=UPI0010B952CD|nr:type II toxin-antitoxin system VapC family toxin [Bathymodiolus heckerae thiotrophic gill symbiont]CAC9532590.1 hypothetical protein [uncultured Gammaproteobacteria bacterium]CAC9584861.1 hypothetical protein [uncultured Gammaproteobacteria bacterium]SHN89189.1 hypothetical protein BHECKSOX_1240 [Bathymodiolus heckerae thiotrophic gill symbiont]
MATTESSVIFDSAIKVDWTRDVFDRLIVAQAMADKAELITKDGNILKHYNKAVW